MKTRRTRYGRWITTALIAAACTWPAHLAVAQPPATEGAAAEAPAEAAEPDLFTVPDGTPEQLLEYVEKLKTARPETTDYATAIQFRDKVLKALLEASDKILASKPNDEQRIEATQLKLIALSMLARTGNADAEATLAKMPEELKKAGLDDLARDAETMVLQNELQTATQAGGEEYKKFVEKIKAYVSGAPIGRREASLVLQVARAAEMLSDSSLAASVNRDFGKLLSTNEDEAIAAAGAQLEATARRMDLPGKEMVVKGVTLDGKPFDWSTYKGKVVLVDFWATWCQPCLAELPNILENYDLYHERGFDVVAISLDNDREQLSDFLADKELPWIVLFDNDLGQDSMGNYYGIASIPTTVLVGKDGKVVTLDAHGPALGEQLARLLGPVEPKKPEQPAAESK